MADTTINLDLNKDAFYRYRFSEPVTIFDSKQIFDNLPLLWDDQSVSGSGTTSTYSKPKAKTTLGVAGTTAGKRVRQTFRRFDYQPGKSQLVDLTGKLGTAALGITKEIGQHDDDNGIFFKMDVNGVYVGIRSSTSGVAADNLVHQNDATYSTDGTSTWNVDAMDGTGASGITIDWTKDQIFFFDYEWLGVGTVAMGVFVNRKPYYVHYFHNANLVDDVYMSTPNNPLRYMIENDGTGAADTLDCICASVITEGGRQETGIKKGILRDSSVGGLTTANNTNLYPVIGIRLKSTHLGAAIALLHNDVMATTTADYSWSLILNPTLAGTSISGSWQNKTNSALQYVFPTGSTTVTNNTGELIDCGLGSDTKQNKGDTESTSESDLKLGAKIDGTPDELFLCVRSIASGVETYYGSITFKES